MSNGLNDGAGVMARAGRGAGRETGLVAGLAAGLVVGLAGLASPALAQTVVVPNTAPTTAGSGGFSTLLHNANRSYQVVIGPSELAAMPAGSRITGIAFRRPTWQAFGAWPASQTTFAGWDVTLSTSNNPPGSLSTSALSNIGPDAVVVRSGALTLPAGFFPGGALTPSVNAFSEDIAFATPYEYKGGNLLITIRHTGNGTGFSGSLDTVPSGATQALGSNSFTGPGEPTGWYAQGLIVLRLTFTAAPACRADLNSDGELTFDDIQLFVTLYNAGDARADFNSDGEWTFDDIQLFVQLYNAGC